VPAQGEESGRKAEDAKAVVIPVCIADTPSLFCAFVPTPAPRPLGTMAAWRRWRPERLPGAAVKSMVAARSPVLVETDADTDW